MVCDKVVCERWCGERWCMTKLCVKDGVVKDGVWQSGVWKMVCVKDGLWRCVKDGVWQSDMKDGVSKMVCERWCVPALSVIKNWVCTRSMPPPHTPPRAKLHQLLALFQRFPSPNIAQNGPRQTQYGILPCAWLPCGSCDMSKDPRTMLCMSTLVCGKLTTFSGQKNRVKVFWSKKTCKTSPFYTFFFRCLSWTSSPSRFSTKWFLEISH